MKTFYEFFLDEIARLQKEGEIDDEKVMRWATEVRGKLEAYSKDYPEAPIVQMPQTH